MKVIVYKVLPPVQLYSDSLVVILSVSGCYNNFMKNTVHISPTLKVHLMMPSIHFLGSSSPVHEHP